MPPVTMKQPQVNKARIAATRMMQDTCTIQATTGSPRGLSTVYSNVPCRLFLDAKASASASAEINQQIVLYKIELPWDTALQDDYQILHASHVYNLYAYVDDQVPLVFKSAYLQRVGG